MAKSPPRRPRVPLVILASVCFVLAIACGSTGTQSAGSTSTPGETEAETPAATPAGTLTTDEGWPSSGAGGGGSNPQVPTGRRILSPALAMVAGADGCRQVAFRI